MLEPLGLPTQRFWSGPVTRTTVSPSPLPECSARPGSVKTLFTSVVLVQPGAKVSAPRVPSRRRRDGRLRMRGETLPLLAAPAQIILERRQVAGLEVDETQPQAFARRVAPDDLRPDLERHAVR